MKKARTGKAIATRVERRERESRRGMKTRRKRAYRPPLRGCRTTSSTTTW